LHFFGTGMGFDVFHAVGNSIFSPTCKPGYRLEKFPTDFLLSSEIQTAVRSTINNIEHLLSVEEDVTSAYDDFLRLITTEMDNSVPRRTASKHHTAKPKCHTKPYWNKSLQDSWSEVQVAEKKWLKCKSSNQTKKILKHSFQAARNSFDKLHKKCKRQYQQDKQESLSELLEQHDSRDFWKEIGKLGIGNYRKNYIPLDVINDDGEVTSEGVMRQWKSDYEKLFNTCVDDSFDASHFEESKIRTLGS